MCLASNYIGKFEEILEDFHSEHKRLSEEVSRYNTMVSDHYHKIETMKFNACEGFYLAKQLQELLRKRRLIKDEFCKINSLRQIMVDKVQGSLEKSKTSVEKSKKKAMLWQKDWGTYKLDEISH
jgi:hypothetical protein